VAAAVVCKARIGSAPAGSATMPEGDQERCWIRAPNGASESAKADFVLLLQRIHSPCNEWCRLLTRMVGTAAQSNPIR
jgi:hypothetical protein